MNHSFQIANLLVVFLVVGCLSGCGGGSSSNSGGASLASSLLSTSSHASADSSSLISTHSSSSSFSSSTIYSTSSSEHSNSSSSLSSSLRSISVSSSSLSSGQANTPPIAYADLILTNEGQAVVFDYLTANDFDAEGDSLNVVSVTPPSHGVLTKLAGNKYRYQPNTGFVGEDTFSYNIADNGDVHRSAPVTIAVNANIDSTTVKNTLLAGVNAFSYSPTRGHMVAFGPTAVNLTNYHDNATPMAVAATLGAGRVVALPGLHWASLDNADTKSKADMEKFFINCLTWLSRSSSKNIHIIHNPEVEISSWLKSSGFTQVTSSENYINDLANTDVLIVWLGSDPTDQLINAVTKYIQGGGAALIVEFGDGFQGYTGWWPKTLPENGGNRVLRKAGIAFGAGWNATPEPLSISGATSISEDDLINLLKTPNAFNDEEKQRIGENLQHVFTALPPHDTLLARLDQYFKVIVETITPTPLTPSTSVFEHLLLKREVQLLATQKVTEVRRHRTAEPVFGKIPANAVRLRNHQVMVNGNWSGMLATGMYAAPGEMVTITVPSVLVGKGYFIRLSGHQDNIGEYNESWNRMPSGIQRSFSIDSATTAVATPYGGAIYIDLLEGADGKSPRTYGELTVQIDGAIQAPYFVLGKNTNQEWLNTLRYLPAPYAEFVTNHLAVSVPSSMIAQIEDPEKLLAYWDEFVVFQDWVGGTEKYRTGPDRINFDAQISVGYLHAGYPIQGPYDVQSSVNFLNLSHLRNHGEWGYFHEVGHEMQNQEHLWSGGYDGNGFTFDGGVEVSVNLFANAALEKMVPVAPKDDWEYSIYQDEVLIRAKATIEDSSKPTFDSKDLYPFYFSLADGFGWEKYRQVLSGYVEDSRANSNKYPKTNQEKKDQWLIRWSQATGYNLIEYMVNRWKLDATESAITAVANMNLPNWLPATTSIEHFKIPKNGQKILDFKSTGLTLDGTATFVRVIEGKNGSLNLNNDGTYTYSAKTDFSGLDQFRVVYKSEVGNEVETLISVQIGE